MGWDCPSCGTPEKVWSIPESGEKKYILVLDHEDLTTVGIALAATALHTADPRFKALLDGLDVIVRSE